MEDFKNSEHLPSGVKDKFSPFLGELLELCPRQIHSVVIYGSAAGTNYVEKRSDINSAVIVESMHLPHDQRVLKLIHRGLKGRIATPFFFTKEYILSSVDVFPVEFLEIKENHVLVYGEDFFRPLEIPPKNLRLFCEHEVKGKFFRIRQAYLEKGLNASSVEVLLKESLNTLIPIFRNLIRLKNHPVDVDKNAVIRTLAQIYSLDASIFEQILNSRSAGLRISADKTQAWMEKYLRELEKLVHGVDRL